MKKFENLAKNQKRAKDKSKNGGFNEFGSITTLVKKYKETNNNDDLLIILEALEGIINTYTLLLCPGNVNQQIYVTPYMKRLLGMFLSKVEQATCTSDTYNQALSRVRFIMRHYSYEDIYSHVLLLLINVIKNVRIIGDCDCFYYIQWIMRFKIHKYIMDQTKDATANVADISNNPNLFTLGEADESVEDALDRLSFSQDNLKHENNVLEKLIDVDSINILVRKDDIFKYFTYYEKYLIYLIYLTEKPDKEKEKDGNTIDIKSILQILKFESEEELLEKIEDIKEKITLLLTE